MTKVNLRQFNVFGDCSDTTLKVLEENSQEVVLEQGQTLIRANAIETHCFIVLSGTLRLLANAPFSEDLYTVGRAEQGDLIGIIDLLRRESCEAAIARQQTRLLLSLIHI